MQEKNYLELKLQELEQRRKKLSELISRLKEDFDLETRPEEEFRLESKIEKQQQKLQKIQDELDVVTKQQQNEEVEELIRKALHTTKTQAYTDAISLWQQVQNIDPDNKQAKHELEKLQQQEKQQANTQQLLGELLQRYGEIKDIFSTVTNVLTKSGSSIEVNIITEQTEKFINKQIDATVYTETCLAMLSTPKTNQDDTNYENLSDRINKGEVVLFIGSNLLHEYGKNTIEEAELANLLAEKIGYSPFTGSLSSIAELYQIHPDYGPKSLLSELSHALPHDGSSVKLYQSLAKTTSPQVLISSSYDNLLQEAFDATGKKYVELSSIINRQAEYDIGHVVVRYSDNKQAVQTYIEEQLSQLRLLEEGYSIIYKIRGTCKEELQYSEQDALTLSESDYFTFARYADHIIPSYVSKQFRDRGFLFIGYSAKNWEDRLLVNILLKKREHHSQRCYSIGTLPDKIEAAYWDNCDVRKYGDDIKELDKYLEEAVS